MREINLRELKQIQLELLKDVHNFCLSNGLHYSLAYGTLLGAVRHKGYIPWDDDIDIMMLRKDYTKFVALYKSDFFRVVDMSVHSDYALPFAKVEDTRTVIDEHIEGGSPYGVNIDVFPVDNVPDEISVRKSFYKRKSFWNALYNLKTVKVRKGRSLKKNFILMLGHVFLWPISRRLVAMKMSELSTTYQNMKTSYVGIISPADSRIEEMIPASYFNDYICVPFEDENVMSIKNSNGYLIAAYGNYMQLPPVEKRVSHHVFKAYWK